MKYFINWLKQMIDLIPPGLRKVRLMDFIWALLEGLRWLYEELQAFISETRKAIGKNGQVIVLEKLLNDAFDTSLRRIYIGDYIGFDTAAVWLISENQVDPAVYLISEIPPGSGLPLFNSSELAGAVNFIVFIPLALQGTINLTHLTGILSAYKYAGMKYIIQYY